MFSEFDVWKEKGSNRQNGVNLTREKEVGNMTNARLQIDVTFPHLKETDPYEEQVDNMFNRLSNMFNNLEIFNDVVKSQRKQECNTDKEVPNTDPQSKCDSDINRERNNTNDKKSEPATKEGACRHVFKVDFKIELKCETCNDIVVLKQDTGTETDKENIKNMFYSKCRQDTKHDGENKDKDLFNDYEKRDEEEMHNDLDLDEEKLSNVPRFYSQASLYEENFPSVHDTSPNDDQKRGYKNVDCQQENKSNLAEEKLSSTFDNDCKEAGKGALIQQKNDSKPMGENKRNVCENYWEDVMIEMVRQQSINKNKERNSISHVSDRNVDYRPENKSNLAEHKANSTFENDCKDVDKETMVQQKDDCNSLVENKRNIYKNRWGDVMIEMVRQQSINNKRNEGKEGREDKIWDSDNDTNALQETPRSLPNNKITEADKDVTEAQDDETYSNEKNVENIFDNQCGESAKRIFPRRNTYTIGEESISNTFYKIWKEAKSEMTAIKNSESTLADERVRKMFKHKEGESVRGVVVQEENDPILDDVFQEHWTDASSEVISEQDRENKVDDSVRGWEGSEDELTNRKDKETNFEENKCNNMYYRNCEDANKQMVYHEDNEEWEEDTGELVHPQKFKSDLEEEKVRSMFYNNRTDSVGKDVGCQKDNNTNLEEDIECRYYNDWSDDDRHVFQQNNYEDLDDIPEGDMFDKSWGEAINEAILLQDKETNVEAHNTRNVFEDDWKIALEDVLSQHEWDTMVDDEEASNIILSAREEAERMYQAGKDSDPAETSVLSLYEDQGEYMRMVTFSNDGQDTPTEVMYEPESYINLDDEFDNICKDSNIEIMSDNSNILDGKNESHLFDKDLGDDVKVAASKQIDNTNAETENAHNVFNNDWDDPAEDPIWAPEAYSYLDEEAVMNLFDKYLAEAIKDDVSLQDYDSNLDAEGAAGMFEDTQRKAKKQVSWDIDNDLDDKGICDDNWEFMMLKDALGHPDSDTSIEEDNVYNVFHEHGEEAMEEPVLQQDEDVEGDQISNTFDNYLRASVADDTNLSEESLTPTTLDSEWKEVMKETLLQQEEWLNPYKDNISQYMFGDNWEEANKTNTNLMYQEEYDSNTEDDVFITFDDDAEEANKEVICQNENDTNADGESVGNLIDNDWGDVEEDMAFEKKNDSESVRNMLDNTSNYAKEVTYRQENDPSINDDKLFIAFDNNRKGTSEELHCYQINDTNLDPVNASKLGASDCGDNEQDVLFEKENDTDLDTGETSNVTDSTPGEETLQVNEGTMEGQLDTENEEVKPQQNEDSDKGETRDNVTSSEFPSEHKEDMVEERASSTSPSNKPKETRLHSDTKLDETIVNTIFRNTFKTTCKVFNRNENCDTSENDGSVFHSFNSKLGTSCKVSTKQQVKSAGDTLNITFNNEFETSYKAPKFQRNKNFNSNTEEVDQLLESATEVTNKKASLQKDMDTNCIVENEVETFYEVETRQRNNNCIKHGEKKGDEMSQSVTQVTNKKEWMKKDKDANSIFKTEIETSYEMTPFQKNKDGDPGEKKGDEMPTNATQAANRKVSPRKDTDTNCILKNEVETSCEVETSRTNKDVKPDEKKDYEMSESATGVINKTASLEKDKGTNCMFKNKIETSFKTPPFQKNKEDEPDERKSDEMSKSETEEMASHQKDVDTNCVLKNEVETSYEAETSRKDKDVKRDEQKDDEMSKSVTEVISKQVSLEKDKDTNCVFKKKIETSFETVPFQNNKYYKPDQSNAEERVKIATEEINKKVSPQKVMDTNFIQREEVKTSDEVETSRKDKDVKPDEKKDEKMSKCVTEEINKVSPQEDMDSNSILRNVLETSSDVETFQKDKDVKPHEISESAAEVTNKKVSPQKDTDENCILKNEVKMPYGMETSSRNKYVKPDEKKDDKMSKGATRVLKRKVSPLKDISAECILKNGLKRPCRVEWSRRNKCVKCDKVSKSAGEVLNKKLPPLKDIYANCTLNNEIETPYGVEKFQKIKYVKPDEKKDNEIMSATEVTRNTKTETSSENCKDDNLGEKKDDEMLMTVTEAADKEILLQQGNNVDSDQGVTGQKDGTGLVENKVDLRQDETDISDSIANRSALMHKGLTCQQAKANNYYTRSGKFGKFKCNNIFCKHKQTNYLEKLCFPVNDSANTVRRTHSMNCGCNIFCRVCGKTFSSKEALTMHHLTHTNGKGIGTPKFFSETDGAYTCPRCKETFKAEMDMRRHIMRRHKK